MPNVLTVDEVAEKLKMSKSTIYKYSEQSIIPSFKIGASLRFLENEVDAYLITLTKEPQKINVS